jgi:hypothetical protein
MKLRFQNTSLYNVRELDDSFASGSIRIMYTGQNRNNSFIPREVVTEALPTLYNKPIVCHWDCDAGTIGAHDVEVVRDEDSVRLRNLTEPCGVVPESATFRFETEEDESGTPHEYLIADGVLLWKRQDVFRHIAEDLDGRVDHSMEISVTNGYADSETGCFYVSKFSFEALCLLETAEPCFEGSELTLYSVSNFQEKMEEMMKDLKATLYSLNTPTPEVDDKDNASTEGGRVLDEMIVQTEAPVPEEPIAEPAVEEAVEAEPAEEIAEPEEDELPEETFALAGDLRAELCEAVSGIEQIEMWYGMSPRYWYIDHDTELGEVYAEDEEDWKLYAFNYVMNGDAVAVDPESKKRMKWAIVPFNEGDTDLPVAEAFSAAQQMAETMVTSKNEELQTYAEQFADYDEITAELNDLRAFKANAELLADAAAREAILDKFQDLVGNAAFDALVEDNSAFGLAELEEKCYAIRGRAHAPAAFALERKVPKIKVDKTEAASNEPYNGLFQKYGIDVKE